MNSPATESADRLSDRLRNVTVRLRNDLQITRHRFRGASHYVVRDPLTFQSHRFDASDYEILLKIRGDRTLGDCFTALCEDGMADAAQEEQFYAFVFSLHRYGFLNLPIADEKLLFQRYSMRQAARRKQRFSSLLFKQVPLLNPDAFLQRTVRFVRPMFTRGAFFGWLLLMLAAISVAAANADSLFQPLNAILATRNLAVMWLTLIILKVIHEFGHAYACKAFGGHVPEMGAFFIIATPCAYVDATACWGLPRKLERIVVCLAGMYFETTIAALAVFVWAWTEPGLLHSIAYNVMFLASLVTIGFNVNPLMRYDGYYVVSDLFEVPNLRARAAAQLKHFAKRAFLGVRDGTAAARGRLRGGLLLFGTAASAYRVLIMVGIAAMLATRFRTLGMFVASLLLIAMIYGLGRQFFSYLWWAEETAPVRGRAIALSAITIIAVPVLLLAVPVQNTIVADGVARREQESTVRAEVSGFLRAPGATVGARLSAPGVMATLENESVTEAVLEAEAELRSAEYRYNEMLATDPAAAHEAEVLVQQSRAELHRRRALQNALTVTALQGGEVIENLDVRDVGRFIQLGEPVARLANGDWFVHALIPAAELAVPGLEPGTSVAFRAVHDTRLELRGVVDAIKPISSEQIAWKALTHMGGGTIVVDQNNNAEQAYIEIIVRLDTTGVPEDLQYGLTGRLLIDCAPEALGIHALRKLLRFTNQLMET